MNNQENSCNSLSCYFDGGASGNPGDGGSAFYIPSVVKYAFHPIGDKTNNWCEAFACLKLLEFLDFVGLLKTDIPITIYGDSAYVINSINKGWIKKWIKYNEYKRPNYYFFERIDKILSECNNVTFVHVKGHDGNEGNEIADKLTWDARDLEQGEFIYDKLTKFNDSNSNDWKKILTECSK